MLHRHAWAASSRTRHGVSPWPGPGGGNHRGPAPAPPSGAKQYARTSAHTRRYSYAASRRYRLAAASRPGCADADNPSSSLPLRRQLRLQRGDDQRMVIRLGQARHADRADQAHAAYQQGKGAAVACKIHVVQVFHVLEAGAPILVVDAHVVGAAAVALDGIVLAAYPVGLVWRGARHGMMEQHLAIARDIDHD